MERISIRGGAVELSNLLDTLVDGKHCPMAVYPDDLNEDTEPCPETAEADAVCRRCWERQLEAKIMID